MINQDNIQNRMNTQNPRSSQFYKTSSLQTENQAHETYQLNKEALIQNLQDQRKFYMEQKQLEIDEAKKKRMSEIKEKKAIESQGLIKHHQRFKSMQISNPYLAQPLYAEPERDYKVPQKIPFIPLKQRIQKSVQARKTNQSPWLSQSSNPIEIFDMNQTLKPTSQQEKQIKEKGQLLNPKLDFQNFKMYMKCLSTKQVKTTTDKSTHQDENKPNKFFQNNAEEQEKSPNQYQLPRSNTFSSGVRALTSQKSIERNIHNDKQQEDNKDTPLSKQSHPYLVNGYNGETPSSVTTKRLQTPLNESSGQNQIYNKLDIMKIDSFVNGSNQKIQTVNSPFSRLQSPMARSPINSTSGQFNRASLSQDKIRNSTQKQQINFSSNANGNSSGNKTLSNWKYTYNPKMNMFQPYPIDVYNVKTSIQPKQANFIFKPNGNLGDLFSNYAKNNKEQENRKRGSSAFQNRVQTNAS